MTDKFKGILWFLFQCLTTSVTFAVVRFAGEGMNLLTMLFWQNLCSMLIFAPIFFRKGISSGLEKLKTKRIKLHMTRSVFGFGGTTSFFYGVLHIPLNQATAISFTGPLFATLAAVLVLREIVRKHRIIGLILGFIGALIVINPDTHNFDPNVMYIVLSVFLMGFGQTFISMLTKTEPSERILFYMILFAIILLSPFAITHWQIPTVHNAMWIVVLTLFIFANLVGQIIAYRHADISLLMPFDFSRLIFTAIVAYFIFDETLKLQTLIGSVVILSGVVYVLHRERLHARMDNNQQTKGRKLSANCKSRKASNRR